MKTEYEIFLVLQIWDGDALDPMILGNYFTAKAANEACYLHAKNAISGGEPENLDPQSQLQTWEVEKGFSRNSASVESITISGDSQRIKALAILNEIWDCETYPFEKIHDGEFRYRVHELLDHEEE